MAPLFAFLAAVGCKASSAAPPASAMKPPSPPPADALVLGFETDAARAAPAGFSAALTGRGSPGAWRVQAAPDAAERRHVLVQTDPDATNYRFPLLVYDGIVATDVDVSVRFAPISGPVDRAA